MLVVWFWGSGAWAPPEEFRAPVTFRPRVLSLVLVIGLSDLPANLEPSTQKVPEHHIMVLTIALFPVKNDLPCFL